jgi:hypothetical protein
MRPPAQGAPGTHGAKASAAAGPGETDGTTSEWVIRYDARLVEQIVLGAIAGRQAVQRRFHAERNRLYGAADPQERESGFEALHRRWFVRLDAGEPVQETLAERPALARATRGVWVGPVASRARQMADLTLDESPPLLVLWLRPEPFLDPDGLRGFLRHELLHLTDMLDPHFGYDRRLPPSEAGPAYDNLLRERYRAVWDATIDGRLVREGLLHPAARKRRLADFAAAFNALGLRLDDEFARWFDQPAPRHQEILAFARAPFGSDARRQVSGEPFSGRCPVCHFPAWSAYPHVQRLKPEVLRTIERAHPSWQPEQGVCVQCAGLYEARCAGPL